MSGVTLVEDMPDRILHLFEPETHFYVAVKGFLDEWLICTDTEVVIAKFGLASGGPFLSSISHIPISDIYNILTKEFAFGLGGQMVCLQNGTGGEGAGITYLGLTAVRKFRMASLIIEDRIGRAVLEQIKGKAGIWPRVAHEAVNSAAGSDGVAGDGMSFAEKDRSMRRDEQEGE